MLNNFAPTIPPIILPMAALHVRPMSYVPLEIYIMELVVVKNIITAKAVACDLCSSTFKILFKIGTKRVPPPEPNSPLIKPVKAPINKNF